MFIWLKISRLINLRCDIRKVFCIFINNLQNRTTFLRKYSQCMLNTKSKNMKTLIATLLLLFTSIFSNAQDLLLSEDFDYPIGDNLNQHNWKPLTSSTDNPIKIVSGLSKEGYSASGGAAYLNKNGQDVVRSFTPVTQDKISIAFQLNYKDMQSRYSNSTCNLFVGDMKISPSNYFMYLSSKAEPNKPLIKFILFSTWCAGPANYLFVLDSQNKPIAGLLLDYDCFRYPCPENKKVIDVAFEYNLTGLEAGKAKINSTVFPRGIVYEGIVKSSEKIDNISNIVLAQSDLTVGSVAIIDRIRVGKNLKSVLPCLTGFENSYFNKRSTAEFHEIGLETYISDVTKHEVFLKTCANTEINKKSGAMYEFRIIPNLSDLELSVPKGFEIINIENWSNEIGSFLVQKTDKLIKNRVNYVTMAFTGNNIGANSLGKYVTGDPGVYEGEIKFTPTDTYCGDLVWKVKGIIEDCKNNADLLLKEDFEYNKGESLTQNNWKAIGNNTSNPIKVIDGLVSNYPSTKMSAAGGAAYLNKSGVDVVRSFKPIEKEKIYVSFQINYKSIQRIEQVNRKVDYLNDFLSPQNYFMFLSSKEEPSRPLLTFSLVSSPVGFDYINYNLLVVRDSNDKIIAKLTLGNEDLTKSQPSPIMNINFSYYLSEQKIGRAFLGSDTHWSSWGANSADTTFSNVKISNLANMALAQSNAYLGSELIIDRIRVGTTLLSITNNELPNNTTESVLEVMPTSLNATIFPNTTDGKVNLLINEKTPEGDFEIKLSDNLGNKLYQNSGSWESQKSAIEEVLSKNNSGQYFFSIKQGNESKTIRVFRE